MDNSGHITRDEKLKIELDHARRKLEFDSVVQLIADYVHSERSREQLFPLRFLDSTEEIESSQREVWELVKLYESGKEIPLAGWTDGYQIIRSIRDESAVATAENLAMIAESEKKCSQVLDFLKKNRDNAEIMSGYVCQFSINQDFIKRVSQIIGQDYQVVDNASHDLQVIRKGILSLRDNLRSKFSDFLSGRSGSEGYEFVTVRGERYVVSLPRHQASKVRGIVHQTSGSGASLYIEPIEFVDENNKLESLVQDEKKEVQRILADLTGEVLAGKEDFLCNQDVMMKLDLVAAKALFARRFRCSLPHHNDNRNLNLRAARHPLLESRFSAEEKIEDLQPLHFQCGSDTESVVISGPNAGGKTVALKTIGLSVLMDWTGLPVPCLDGSDIPRYRAVFVDIGDDQSIEKSLSTFSSRIRRLKNIIELADRNSLVLIDEIGDGTDPDEGAALAESVLNYFVERGVKDIVTTHMRSLKSWAHVKEGAVNATLEFDVDSLKPLFKLRMGVPGRSWGIEVAGRLGLSGEVISGAKEKLGTEAVHLEELLAYLEETKQELRKKIEGISSREKYLDKLISSYSKLTESFKKEREKLAKVARKEALDIVASTRKDMENLIRKIRSGSAQRGVIKEAKDKINSAIDDLENRIKSSGELPSLSYEQIEPGMWYEIASLGKKGKVASKVGKSRVFLELEGGIRVETRVGELIPCDQPEEYKDGHSVSWSTGDFEPVSSELMVRGLNRMEALEKVDFFVDKAVLQGLKKVTIIHGIGHGILKEAIYSRLKNDPRVSSIHPGEAALGGDGVAVVELR
jgi:DNA mismatch repair protein MutS2